MKVLIKKLTVAINIINIVINTEFYLISTILKLCVEILIKVILEKIRKIIIFNDHIVLNAELLKLLRGNSTNSIFIN